ncbi:hypothetical protein MLD38_004680 [Melastoma candidum]|uniref:Uncharacterized protein n=1 Tax=Melastoma candidum TaxID=119954 RepID=A0ACB9SBF2_9MYRT|nr:hypothetical protein MLD38_004680 [Melastoma candidum]
MCSSQKEQQRGFRGQEEDSNCIPEEESGNTSNKFWHSLTKKGRKSSKVLSVDIEDMHDAEELKAVNAFHQALILEQLLPSNDNDYHMLLRVVANTGILKMVQSGAHVCSKKSSMSCDEKTISEDKDVDVVPAHFSGDIKEHHAHPCAIQEEDDKFAGHCDSIKEPLKANGGISSRSFSGMMALAIGVITGLKSNTAPGLPVHSATISTEEYLCMMKRMAELEENARVLNSKTPPSPWRNIETRSEQDQFSGARAYCYQEGQGELLDYIEKKKKQPLSCRHQFPSRLNNSCAH